MLEPPISDTLCDLVQNHMCAGPDYIFYKLLYHSTSTTGIFLSVDAPGSGPIILLLETQSLCVCLPQCRQDLPHDRQASRLALSCIPSLIALSKTNLLLINSVTRSIFYMPLPTFALLIHAISSEVAV